MRARHALTLTLLASVLIGCADEPPAYLPELDSLHAHPLPTWFDDAKLGIIIHWGPYSVPGWASHEFSPNENLSEGYWAANPYAEWYQNTLRIGGSATAVYHDATWGADVAYEDFGPMFEEQSAGWDASDWARTFAAAGARYAVLTTKHHDGYLLWPSRVRGAPRAAWFSERDLVGEFVNASRAEGLRVGLYYSGGLDWTFTTEPIESYSGFFDTPLGPAYADYVDGHLRELVRRYRPDLIWNDVGSPAEFDRLAFFAHYYNQVPDGVLNNRWAQGGLEVALSVAATEQLARSQLRQTQFDFYGAEYQQVALSGLKFELVRAIGDSFGYNRADAESDAPVLTPLEAIALLVEVASKNGNLSLGVGPRADGSIPEEQLAVLTGLGEWMAVNGVAIHGTRPWIQDAGAATAAGSAAPTARFTTRRTADGDLEELYVFVYDLDVSEPSVRVAGIPAGFVDVRRLDGEVVTASPDASDVAFESPGGFPPGAVTTIALRYR